MNVERQQVALKIADFTKGLDINGDKWDIEKSLFNEELIQVLRELAEAGILVYFSVEGPARSGWAFEAKVKEGKKSFRLEAQAKQKHFDHARSERLTNEAAKLRPYAFITIAEKSAVISCLHDDGTFQVVYEQSSGKHIAEDAKFNGEKRVL